MASEPKRGEGLPAQSGGSVRGVNKSSKPKGDLIVEVVEDPGGAKVAGAEVSVSGPENPPASKTDAQGKATFSGIEAGSYTVKVVKAGILDATGSATVTANTKVNLTVKMTPCTKAEIKKPTDPPSWLTSPCYHFDFQGVASGTPGSYKLTLQGQVTPAGYGYKWKLDAAAGKLTKDTEASPIHDPPAKPGEGTLTLSGMAGATKTGCADTRKVEIYEDHLARDYENFGTGTSCKVSWTFKRFGVTVKMGNKWNCHGSTLHIYNGSGTGLAREGALKALLAPKLLKKEVKVTHTDKGGGTHPPLGSLSRGDIVAYYTGNGQLAHTQTCTGNGTETYGANNVPVKFPGMPGVDEAWKWATSTAGDWANNIKKDVFVGATPFTIKVFRRP